MLIAYHSFEGRYSDNPRAIHEGLLAGCAGHRHLWLADPAHLEGYPSGVETVTYGSPECIEALQAADLVVANTHTDLEWVKRPDAIYLQTWHGTPLKRIHWDVLWAPEGRLERLSRDVVQWDRLLSASPFSTRALRGAFRYEGEVLETGYPRNDVLNAPDRDEIRARLRRELGIADDVTAVLYTPTWRDDFVFAPEPRDFELQLDVDGFVRRLGEDHCLLLRVHYMLTGRLRAARHDAVRDVSAYPDVRDLYLAADVLVTDYSSTMFDFAVTGRPMIFYAYDLDDYRTRQRGLYLDFAALAPGPLVATTEGLIDQLSGLNGVRDRYAERYARFRERFCPWEDGRATQRVLERLGLVDAPSPAGART